MEQCEAYLCLLSPHIEEREKHYLGEKRHMREQQQLAFMIARYYGANALIVRLVIHSTLSKSVCRNRYRATIRNLGGLEEMIFQRIVLCHIRRKTYVL